jgi:integrase
MGINTGLRISDLLPLKVEDVRGRTHIVITEEKTDKEKRFKVNGALRESIDKYIEGMEDGELLFPSRKGEKPMTRVQAY